MFFRRDNARDGIISFFAIKPSSGVSCVVLAQKHDTPFDGQRVIEQLCCEMQRKATSGVSCVMLAQKHDTPFDGQRVIEQLCCEMQRKATSGVSCRRI